MSADSSMEKGQISIHTENIFPIIKKWLYSEKDIFLRELVSNAVDAIHKMRQVNLAEGLQLEDTFAVDVHIDSEAGTLTVSDNGIGMTADEIRRYINQIAFSSAEEFVEKFKEVEDKNQIIGHFGLGFYSSFMVADRVEIRSLSYQQGAEAAHWQCAGSTEYELGTCDKHKRGTEVILHLRDDEKEFLDASRVRAVLQRYCNFLPVTINLEGSQVNESEPLWTKPATELSDEDYKNFYQKLYPASPEPLFWIHLNVDYPFNLKGIVYFPKLTTEFDVSTSHIKLFCNQVFVSDNCPELIPEFLNPLQGCLNAPDLPLNVSRSYLQNDPQVRKIREVLAGRVASKINDLAKQDVEAFAPIWEDIHTFVKYGMMRDDKFYDKVKDNVIYRSTQAEQGYTTLPDYLERAQANGHENTVYYTNDEAAQATYLRLFKQQGLEVLVLDAFIDSHFVAFLESKNSDVSFKRVDADVTQNLIEEDHSNEIVSDAGKTRSEQIKEAFQQLLGDEKLTLRVESLKDETTPAMLLLNEQNRRIKEMTRMMGQGGEQAIPDEYTLLLNSTSPVVRNVLSLQDQGNTEKAQLVAQQVYDLASMAQQAFDSQRMESFVARSNKLLEELTQNS